MSELPGSILFACTHNAIRSPMAENIMRFLHGRQVFVQSAGVRPVDLDPFAVAVMDEIGIDLSRHRPRSFDELEDDYFDLVVSLSPEAQHSAVELTRTSHCELEFWRMPDPSLVEGARETRLDAYRTLRDLLMRRILERFPLEGAPQILADEGR
jgi:protein-tyrosine-phosphatase